MKTIITQKSNKVDEIVKLLEASKSFVIFEYQGLSAADVTILRKKLITDGSKMLVLKNNISIRALNKSNIKDFDNLMTGPNAIAFGLEDEMSVFKNIIDTKKEFDFIKVKGGYFNGKFVTPTEIAAIAAIPGREGLYGMLLSCLTSPIRSVLYAIKAVADSKQ